jgi:hypothetical protein
MLEKIGSFQQGEEKIFHVKGLTSGTGFDPRNAKITECVSNYFDKSINEETWKKEHWDAFVGEAEKIEGVEAQGMFFPPFHHFSIPSWVECLVCEY